MLLLVLVVGCTTIEPTTTTGSPSPDPTGTTLEPVTREHNVVVYLLADPAVGVGGPYLVPVHRTWMGESAAKSAFEALLAGYTFGEVDLGLGSAVPFETQLRSARLEPPVALIDLSTDFESGGGTASMHGRLGQLVYTATQFDDDVDQVKLLLDGQPVTVFSSEGIDLSEPLTRLDYSDLLAPAAVEWPAWEEPVQFPLTLQGSLLAQGGSFRWSLVDWDGLILAEGIVDVPDSETGRRTFEHEIDADLSAVVVDRSRLSDGALIIEATAVDGSGPTIIEIPLRFAELR